MNLSATFLGPPERWPAVRLALRDVHGLWGGHALDLAGDGQGSVRVIAPTGHVQHFPLAVTPAQVAALLEQLIASDFLALAFPLRPAQPDEARPVITITNSAGETRAIAKWANEHSPDFERVYQALLALVRQAANDIRPGKDLPGLN